MQNKPPIIFLHGWGGRISSWDNNISYFEKLGYPVFALKMPGFDLPNPLPTWGIPEYAKFAKEAIAEKFPNQKVVLAGHSFGGRVSVLLASSEPNLVQGLILTSSAGLNLEPSGLRKGLIFVSSIARKLEQNAFLSGLIGAVRTLVRSLIGSRGYKKADETMKEVFKNVVNLDLQDRLSAIKCPTLVLWGEEDKTTPINMARAFAAGISGSTLKVIKGAKHSAHQTHSDEWNNIVSDFLKTL